MPNNIHDGLLDDTIKDPIITENKDLENLDQNNKDENDTEDLDLLSTFLKSKGLKNGSLVSYTNDNDELTEVDFNTLSKEEQLSIINELTDPGLSDEEIETINLFRDKKISLSDYTQSIKEFAIKEYEESNNVQKTYSVDDYSDDELFLADLKSKFSEMTDEELESELILAKTNEALFKKKSDIIRSSYKAYEEDQINQEKESQEIKLKEFTETVSNIVNDFNFIPVGDDRKLTLDKKDKEQVLSYILKTDSDGYSKFFKDLNDPNIMVELAWYRLNGTTAIENINSYWKNVINSIEKPNLTESIPKTTVVTEKPKDGYQAYLDSLLK